jgi:hypothetical protein
MDKNEEERQAIKAYQGRLFRVSLQSHFGSSNAGWCLSSLPKGIAFLAEEDRPDSRGNTSTTQVFSFCALDAVGKAELEFRLIAHLPTISKKEQLQTVTIKVLVVSHNVDEGGIGKDRFVEYRDNQACFNEGDSDDCTQVLKYGYPPYMKYGYPAPALKYGYPGCDAQTNLKYGYACVNNSQDIRPYGYPGCDATQANLKYGYPPPNPPCAVFTDENGCPVVVKYGFPPLPKYGYPGCDIAQANFKYGYPPPNPSCEVVPDENGCPVVKYGFPPAIKYGYPSCR